MAFGGLYHCAKFGWNRCSSFGNMHVFWFREFGLKMPIHAPKLGVLGENRGRVGAILTPNSFLLLGVYTSVSNLVKIDEEMRPWECSQTDTRLTIFTWPHMWSSCVLINTYVGVSRCFWRTNWTDRDAAWHEGWPGLCDPFGGLRSPGKKKMGGQFGPTSRWAGYKRERCRPQYTNFHHYKNVKRKRIVGYSWHRSPFRLMNPEVWPISDITQFNRRLID